MSRHYVSLFSILLTYMLSGNVLAGEDQLLVKEQKRQRVAPYLKPLTHFENADLVGANFFMIFGQSEEVKGDSRAGIGLKSFSTRGWLYQDLSLDYLGGYQEVVSPVEPKHIYDDLIISYKLGLSFNMANIIIPYIAIGPGLTLREDSQVICRESYGVGAPKKDYCFDNYGSYETQDVQYYFRPNLNATAGLKIRIRGFEFDLNGYVLAIPSETSSGVKIGAGFSI